MYWAGGGGEIACGFSTSVKRERGGRKSDREERREEK